MSPRILYLFPDTNLFAQCQPLEQLDWSIWGEFDEVHLLVCRAVQSEIDYHKNRGSSRLGTRARATSGLFREILLGPDDCKVLKLSGPCVKLFIKPEYLPSEDLSGRLNFQERDDQLVGTVHAFIRANPGAEARVLTHDTGPMASAQMVAVPIAPIPDSWLLPPESSDAERKIGALEQEVARLKRTEPDFRIALIDGEGKQIDRLDIEPIQYEKLNANELSELMARLASGCPPASDFGPREEIERDAETADRWTRGRKEIYRPASEEEITTYAEDKYPGWLERCESLLRDHHKSLQHRAGQPGFSFLASNEGTRPAKDALVAISARGNFRIKPPPYRDEDKAPEEGTAALPLPPAPPSGKWKPSLTRGESLAARAILERFNGLSSYGPLGFPRTAFIPPPITPLDRRRDPNAFYYKPTRSPIPAAEFSLECEQWRHGVEPEVFQGEIYFDVNEERIAGVLECQIHAENLASVAVLQVPVRIAIRNVRACDSAAALVDELIARVSSRRHASVDPDDD